MIRAYDHDNGQVYVVADEKDAAGLRSLGFGWVEDEKVWWADSEAVTAMLEQLGFSWCQTEADEKALDRRRARG